MYNMQLYATNNSEQKATAERFFTLFGGKLRDEYGSKQISLLDIGSGCGKVLSEVILQKSGLNISSVVGVDKSLEMIKLAEKNCSNSFTTFCFMDAEGDIPEVLKDKQFNLVTSMYCFHWIKDLGKAFQNVYNLLNDGGLFCCTFLAWNIGVNIWCALEEKYAPYMKDWKNFFSPLWCYENADEMMKRHLIESGFTISEFHDARNERFDYQTAQNFSRAMEAVNPCLKSMPDDLREEYLKDQLDLLSSMQKEHPAVNSSRLLYFIAKKET